MDPLITRLTEALEADMSAMASAALTLEKHNEIRERDELYARVRADAELVREVRKH